MIADVHVLKPINTEKAHAMTDKITAEMLLGRPGFFSLADQNTICDYLTALLESGKARRIGHGNSLSPGNDGAPVLIIKLGEP